MGNLRDVIGRKGKERKWMEKFNLFYDIQLHPNRKERWSLKNTYRMDAGSSERSSSGAGGGTDEEGGN